MFYLKGKNLTQNIMRSTTKRGKLKESPRATARKKNIRRRKYPVCSFFGMIEFIFTCVGGFQSQCKEIKNDK